MEKIQSMEKKLEEEKKKSKAMQKIQVEMAEVRQNAIVLEFANIFLLYFFNVSIR
jgi:hypothetical protein